MNFISSKKYKKQIQVKHTESDFLFDYTSHPPSLQNIAAVSIAIKLWTEPDIREEVKQYSENLGFDYTPLGLDAYDRFKERVLQKLSDTLLPNSLKCKVSDIIQPIGIQFLKCFSKDDYGQAFRAYVNRISDRYMYDTSQTKDQDRENCRFYDIYKAGGSVYWTMDGRIDNVVSLKEIIANTDQGKDFYYLYQLACKYCLEEYIPELWRQISPDKKNELDFIYGKYKYHLIAYWTAVVENKMLNLFSQLKQHDVRNLYQKNLSMKQNMISQSIFIGNPYSFKYFWYQLKEQEKNSNLRNWVNQVVNSYTLWGSHEYKNCNDRTGILCFLLSQLKDGQQQKEVLQVHSEIILRNLFFHWPWQKFFMLTISKMLDYIPEKAFVEIMSLIADNNKKRNPTVELFREIWLKSHLKSKRYFIQSLEDSTSTLYRFLEMDDVETIFMLFKYATAEEKKRILFNMIKSNYSLFEILYSNKLNLIDTLVTKSLTSSCDIDHFKNCVMSDHANDLCDKWIADNNFHAVDKFLEWGMKSPDKIMPLKDKLIDKNKTYSSLICLGDYELINRFMHWCFESEDEISEFKIKFTHQVDADNSFICSHLLSKLSSHQQGWDLFEKFVSYNFHSTKEVSEFKSKYLESVTSVLESFNFEFADKFVMWCLGSVDESNRFKNSFVLSERGKRFILNAVNLCHPYWHHPSDLIKWLSISKETAAKLKHKLDKIEFFSKHCNKTDADYKRRALFYLIDKHTVDNSTGCKDGSDSKNDEINITKEIMEALSKSPH